VDKDRRKSERVKLKKPVSARLATYASGRVVDVSPQGISVKVRKRLKVGSVYRLAIAFPEMKLEMLGTVKRCPLAGFETDEDADRVRVYHAALEFEKELSELAGRFKPGDALEVSMEECKG